MFKNDPFAVFYSQNNISREKHDEMTCPECGTSRTCDSNSALYICCNCGSCETVHFISDSLPFDTITKKYRPTIHLREFLNRLNNSETTKVPNDVIKKIASSLGTRNVTPLQLRKTMKNLGFSKFNENIVQIFTEITKRQQKRIPHDKYQAIIKQFNRLKYKAHEQNIKICNLNFLVFKLLERVGERELQQFCFISKNKKKLRTYNKIWETLTCQS